MPRMNGLRTVSRRNRDASFTLIELLVVMAIIAILVGLTLAAATAVMNKGMRSRASTEVQAMGTALESYKTDNGIYPQSDAVLIPSNYTNYDGSSAYTEYQTNSTLLYIALSGQASFATTPVAGTKSYMSFKANQVGNPGGTYSYVQDPWAYSYAYSTGSVVGATTNAPYNGYGFFDLWSTGGTLKATANTNAWLSNWQ